MKRMFTADWLLASLPRALSERIVPARKKTSWYERAWTQDTVWIGAALMVPFGLFLLWRAVTLLRGESSTVSDE